MEQIGYSLVVDGHEVQHWGDTAGQCARVPSFIVLPNGDQVHCPLAGSAYGGCQFVSRYLAYTGSDGISFDGEKVVVAKAPPEPVQTPPRCIAAAFGLQVADGDITNIEGSFNFIAALYVDVGLYMLFFCTSEPDTNYLVQVISQASMDVVEKSTDYILVSATTGVGGSPVDVSAFNVQIFRI